MVKVEFNKKKWKGEKLKQMFLEQKETAELYT